MKSAWIEHKGKRLYFANYSGLASRFEDVKKEIDFVNAALLREPPGSVLLLVDVRDTVGTPEITDYLTESARKVKNICRKTAVVGVTGYRKIIMRGIAKVTGMEFMAVDTLEAAKDWLAGG